MNEREQLIADFIDAYWAENWTSPTVREMTVAAGLASKSSTQYYLLRMVESGVLERKKLGAHRVLYRVR